MPDMFTLTMAAAIRRNRRRRELIERLTWLRRHYFDFEDQGKAEKADRLIALINAEIGGD